MKILASFNRYIIAYISAHPNEALSFGSEFRSGNNIRKIILDYRNHKTIMNIIRNI